MEATIRDADISATTVYAVFWSSIRVRYGVHLGRPHALAACNKCPLRGYLHYNATLSTRILPVWSFLHDPFLIFGNLQITFTMSASVQDYQIAALAAGFTLGFGFLTVWEATKQTRRNRNPLRSVYIYMLWGEIAANVGIGIIGWLFLNGVLGPTLPVLFFILFFWVFEIQ